MTGTRDYQRSKVYAWQNRVIAPSAPGVVSFDQSQGMVNAIWAEVGLKYPPAIERLPKQARATVASATRLERFPINRKRSSFYLASNFIRSY